MSLCLACKFGNRCPYMENIEDFVHIMVEEGTMMQKLQDQLDRFNIKVQKKYSFSGPLADRGIELGLEISHCEGFQRLYI